MIGAFCAAPPEPDEITELIIQLTDLNYSRKVEAACEKIKRHAAENIGILEKNDKINRIVAESMKVPITQGEKATRLWNGYVEQKEYDAAHPDEKEEVGYDWPYETVSGIYGKLRKGCVHVIVAHRS